MQYDYTKKIQQLKEKKGVSDLTLKIIDDPKCNYIGLSNRNFIFNIYELMLDHNIDIENINKISRYIELRCHYNQKIKMKKEILYLKPIFKYFMLKNTKKDDKVLFYDLTSDFTGAIFHIIFGIHICVVSRARMNNFLRDVNPLVNSKCVSIIDSVNQCDFLILNTFTFPIIKDTLILNKYDYIRLRDDRLGKIAFEEHKVDDIKLTLANMV